MAELPKNTENPVSYDSYPSVSRETDLERVHQTETLENAQDEERRRILHSRRSFLRTAGKVGMYSAVALSGGMELMHLDTKYGEGLQHGSEMKLDEVAKASPGQEHKATLFIPGFNVTSGVPSAEALASVAREHGNVVGFTHAASRFSIETLEQYIRTYIDTNNITSMTLLGSSLGGLISVDLASRIQQVDTVIADSSPADPSDARQLPQGFMKSVTEGVSWLLDTLELSGGPNTRTVTEFVKRLHDGDKSTVLCLQEALSLDYTSACSNALALDLYLYMLTHNIQADANQLHDVAFGYMGADDPRRDIVVDQSSASKKYAQLAAQSNNTFAQVTSPKTAHTDIPAHPDAYQKMYADLQLALAAQRKVSFMPGPWALRR